jgi:DNA-binding transcriptional LysR family regulator
VLLGATPFKRRTRKVPLQEAAKELLGLLKQVKRAARALAEAQELHGVPGMTQPFVPGLIKEAAAADGEVQ